MKNLGLCTWSLKNELKEVTRTMQEAGLSSLHLEASAIDAFKQAIEEHQWRVSCTMIGFPQEDYSTMDRIRETGGIIPDDDAKRLLAMGVARVYTPKDFELNSIMNDIVTLADPAAVAAE